MLIAYRGGIAKISKPTGFHFFFMSNICCRTGERRILFSLSGTTRPQNACFLKKQFIVKPIVMDRKFQKGTGKIRENPQKMYDKIYDSSWKICFGM